MVSEATARNTFPQSGPATQFERDIYVLEASGYALIPDFIDDVGIETLLRQHASYQEEVDAFASRGANF